MPMVQPDRSAWAFRLNLVEPEATSRLVATSDTMRFLQVTQYDDNRRTMPFR